MLKPPPKFGPNSSCHLTVLVLCYDLIELPHHEIRFLFALYFVQSLIINHPPTPHLLVWRMYLYAHAIVLIRSIYNHNLNLYSGICMVAAELIHLAFRCEKLKINVHHPSMDGFILAYYYV